MRMLECQNIAWRQGEAFTKTLVLRIGENH